MAVETQPERALARANAVRVARAGLKRRIAAGELSVADALFDIAAPRMPVVDLLTAQHRWGGQRARRTMRRVGASEDRRVEDLTARQLAALIEVLGE